MVSTRCGGLPKSIIEAQMKFLEERSDAQEVFARPDGIFGLVVLKIKAAGSFETMKLYCTGNNTEIAVKPDPFEL